MYIQRKMSIYFVIFFNEFNLPFFACRFTRNNNFFIQISFNDWIFRRNKPAFWICIPNWKMINVLFFVQFWKCAQIETKIHYLQQINIFLTLDCCRWVFADLHQIRLNLLHNDNSQRLYNSHERVQVCFHIKDPTMCVIRDIVMFYLIFATVEMHLKHWIYFNFFLFILKTKSYLETPMDWHCWFTLQSDIFTGKDGKVWCIWLNRRFDRIWIDYKRDFFGVKIESIEIKSTNK